MGCYNFVDGRVYYGEWLNNKRHGFGIQVWNEKSKHHGAVYIGQWENEMFEGYGIYFYPDGRRYEGKWK
jgi:hypothetical protein